MKRRAIFDLDGTIFRSSLTIELLELLIEEGVFPEKAKKMFARPYARWLDRKGSYEEYILATVRAFEIYFKGKKRKDVMKIARKVAAFHHDKVYGRLHEVDSRGRFTGRHLFVDTIDDKANLVKHLVDKKGYSLRGSIGVGDTESDSRFLEMVETPICFNPNLKLYKHAKRHGWTVVVERKDVIYVMNKGSR